MPEPAPSPLPSQPADARAAPKAKILVVDDDERNALAVVNVLTELGQELVVAYSGEDALRHLLFDDFAVILLDVHMPGMDGYEAATLIRGRRKTRHIPIVFLTAVFRDDSHLLQAYSAGAVDMVFKPVDPFILRSKVSVFVDLYLKQAEIQREAELRHKLQEDNFRVRTEKLIAEQNLQRREEDYRLLVQGVRDYAIYMLDQGGRITSWNAGAERLKQYTAAEITGEHFSRFYTEEDRQRGLPELALQTAAAEGRYEVEGWRVRKDGTVFWAHAVIESIYDERGTLVGFAKITRDITERRNLEQQLIQAQKMEAVGQLTGGIAHDFNNLLTVILGNLDLVGRHVEGNERLQRQLSAMRHAAERGRSLTGQLLAFSRRQRLTPVTIDVNKLVRGFEPLIQRAVGERVSVDLKMFEETAACEVDPSQLETTLLNLAVNAHDAMPDGGTLAIEVRYVEFDTDLIERQREASPGPWVVLSVRDTGTGMSKDVAGRAFEPFFTTKEPGKGSGLGLSQVYGFVRQSGGYVTLNSSPGGGTQLSIYLHPSDKPIQEQVIGEEDRPSTGGDSETILLVEDDAPVLALATEMLCDLGYRVITATDANGALEILRREDSIDLVFSDVVMPGGKTGVQLAAEAREIRSSIKVLLTSGYTGEALARYGANHPQLPILPKPFRQLDLAEGIRKALKS